MFIPLVNSCFEKPALSIFTHTTTKAWEQTWFLSPTHGPSWHFPTYYTLVWPVAPKADLRPHWHEIIFSFFWLLQHSQIFRKILFALAAKREQHFFISIWPHCHKILICNDFKLNCFIFTVKGLFKMVNKSIQCTQLHKVTTCQCCYRLLCCSQVVKNIISKC